MDIKTISILNLLLGKEDYVSFKEVSLKMGERMIRYEIEKLKELLSFQQVVTIEQDRKRGLLLKATAG